MSLLSPIGVGEVPLELLALAYTRTLSPLSLTISAKGVAPTKRRSDLRTDFLTSLWARLSERLSKSPGLKVLEALAIKAFIAASLGITLQLPGRLLTKLASSRTVDLSSTEVTKAICLSSS
jgi:hypothetical protein